MGKHFEVSYETVSSNFSDVLHRRIVQSCQMWIVGVETSKAARAFHMEHKVHGSDSEQGRTYPHDVE